MLLINDLLTKTESAHPDYNNLASALKIIEEVMHFIDKSITEAQNREQMFKFAGVKGAEVPFFSLPHLTFPFPFCLPPALSSLPSNLPSHLHPALLYSIFSIYFPFALQYRRNDSFLFLLFQKNKVAKFFLLIFQFYFLFFYFFIFIFYLEKIEKNWECIFWGK